MIAARELMAELKAAGLSARAEGQRLWVTPKELLTVELRQRVARHKFELLAIVTEAAWSPGLGELIVWFEAELAAGRLPRQPFRLCRWAVIGEPAGFYAALQRDIADGPLGVRARLGGLESELTLLRKCMAFEE